MQNSLEAVTFFIVNIIRINQQLMKSLITILLVVVFPFMSNGQNRTVEDVLNQQELKKKRYRLDAGYLDAIVINMSFGESAVVSMMDKANLKNASVFQVDIVFTDYPKNIDLNHLNKQRILKALEARRDLVIDKNVTWKLIRQMDCESEAEAKTLFHGVVIHYKKGQTERVRQTDKAFYDSILPKNDSVPVGKEQLKQFKDTTVTTVFRRNKQWKNATVVADVTGSMSPYISQLALWFLYKLNHKEVTNLVLFNDGDDLKNELKITGKTGGIYTKSTNNYRDFVDVLQLATSRGFGGDLQENAVEAILKAQELYPNSTEIIFIADNYAPIRDAELISNIKIPVRVVLCGTQLFANPHYLNLARKTGGSVHSMEQDLVDLSKLVEGKTFLFNRQMYIFKNGEIIPYERT